MKPIKGYNDIQTEGEYKRLTPGGYVLIINRVKNMADKEYLDIVYDVAEGPNTGMFADISDDKDYLHHFTTSYSREAGEKKKDMLPAFRHFIKTIDEINGTKLDDQVESGLNEQLLVGKIIGVVFGGKEKISDRGNTYIELGFPKFMSAERIRKGNFEVPELKKLKVEDAPTIPAGFTALADSDLPF